MRTRKNHYNLSSAGRMENDSQDLFPSMNESRLATGYLAEDYDKEAG
jgi:hypothetical protein